MTGTKAAFQNAISKAQSRGGATAAERDEFAPNTYRVASANEPGTVYVVNVTRDHDYFCTCPAGKKDKPCWHCAAVWLRLVAEYALPKPAPVAIGRAAADAYLATLDASNDRDAALLEWRRVAGR